MTAILEQLEEALKKQLSGCCRFSIAMALVSRDGLAMIEPALDKCLKRDGVDGQLLFGINLPTDPEAISRLMELANRHRGNFTLRRFESGRQGVFHSKLYLFESQRGSTTAILGSSNLTVGGLIANVEANVLVSDSQTVQSLWCNFDEHFEGGHAKNVDAGWLASYRQIWQQHEVLWEKWRRSASRVNRLPEQRIQSQPIPKRIQGNHFLFTGRIPDHPRRELYPEIERLGGVVRKRANSAGTVHCLVHGEIVGASVKLKAARKVGTPVIHEQQFLAILDRERKLRRKKKG